MKRINNERLTLCIMSMLPYGRTAYARNRYAEFSTFQKFHILKLLPIFAE